MPYTIIQDSAFHLVIRRHRQAGSGFGSGVSHRLNLPILLREPIPNKVQKLEIQHRVVRRLDSKLVLDQLTHAVPEGPEFVLPQSCEHN